MKTNDLPKRTFANDVTTQVGVWKSSKMKWSYILWLKFQYFISLFSAESIACITDITRCFENRERRLKISLRYTCNFVYVQRSTPNILFRVWCRLPVRSHLEHLWRFVLYFRGWWGWRWGWWWLEVDGGWWRFGVVDFCSIWIWYVYVSQSIQLPLTHTRRWGDHAWRMIKHKFTMML